MEKHAAASRVLITTVPFGQVDSKPLDLLNSAGARYLVNPLNRKLKEEELADMARDYQVIIAGTEPITRRVMENAPDLRHISRVGIGLDSVDLVAARERGIKVSYTPDPPAPAVAELTLGLMLSLLRGVHQSDRTMRAGGWRRIFGRRLAECTVGIIGLGRIGKGVVRHLSGFGPRRILAHDINPDHAFAKANGIIWADPEQIYREADIITLHVPLTGLTANMITAREIGGMRPETLLINTARGGIINEEDLAAALRAGQIQAAAVDTFLCEPYAGELAALDNCLLTCHMGSMSVDCRTRMEIDATAEAVRLLRGEPLEGLVPEFEYDIQVAKRCPRAVQ
ncbi:phosphoglycerate dehydrogenase [Solidesulfovibrio sp.]